MSALHDFFHACQGRQVTPESAGRGLLAGAAAGALITGLPGILGGPLVFMTVLIAFLFWATGVALAAPVWWLMHRLKLRCWSACMLLGAVAAPLGTRFFGGWYWPFMAIISIVGAIVGLVVWNVAYRKPAEGAVCA